MHSSVGELRKQKHADEQRPDGEREEEQEAALHDRTAFASSTCSATESAAARTEASHTCA